MEKAKFYNKVGVFGQGVGDFQAFVEAKVSNPSQKVCRIHAKGSVGKLTIRTKQDMKILAQYLNDIADGKIKDSVYDETKVAKPAREWRSDF